MSGQIPTAPIDLGFDLRETNARLEGVRADERVAWAVEQFGDGLVLSSSFGAQAGVMLHLATRAKADIPVILVDTGYLFPETYRFVDELTERLSLNLKVYRAELSPAWQEARHGKRWENGVSQGLDKMLPSVLKTHGGNRYLWVVALAVLGATTLIRPVDVLLVAILLAVIALVVMKLANWASRIAH